jgi:DNA-binding transcriptional LysR family regulator
MRTSQIEAVLAVAEAGSFSASALRLGVSQSSLSRSIGAMELEVGARLLRRPGPSVVLTAQGEAFAAAAPAVLAAVTYVRSVVAPCPSDRNLHAGCVTTLDARHHVW